MHIFHRRKLLTFATAAAALTVVPSLHAQSVVYPEKPVRLVVPYAAGGGTDQMARLLGQKLTQLWGQPVIVDNRPGASEAIAASIVARAPADGYTLMFVSDSTFQMNPLLYSKLTYDPDKDLLPITRFSVGPVGLIVSAAMPVNTFKEFISYARSKQKKLAYGSYGVANQTNLALSWMSKQLDLDMLHVPFAGQAPATLALLSGEIDVILGNVVPSSIGFIKQGKIKVLAMSGENRLPNAPDAPTFRELGFNDLDTSITMGLAAPTGTSPAIIDKIVADVRKVAQDPEAIKFASDNLSMRLMAETPTEYKAFISRSRNELEQRIKAAGIGKLD